MSIGTIDLVKWEMALNFEIVVSDLDYRGKIVADN